MINRSSYARQGRIWVILLLTLTAACNGKSGDAKEEQHKDPLPYVLTYEVKLDPREHAAKVTIRVDEGAKHIHFMRFRTDPERHRDFKGKGELTIKPNSVRWVPPRGGGTLHYTFRIDHRRNEKGYDSLMTRDWAIFRGGDMVPPARVDTVKERGEAQARLKLELPDQWTAATPYPRENGVYVIERPERRFDRPTGWFIAGRLGILRERIAGTQVTVAAPLGHRFRRHDYLALLNWTLPTLKNMVGRLPARLLIVGANDPMWRGGLSGPGSFYVHTERPLIGPDGTSPLLHELMHTVMRARSGSDGDWVVEGLAEYYSLKLLIDSSTISPKRYEKTLAEIAQRGQKVKVLPVEHSSGDVTARATTALHELDQEIRKETAGQKSLDDVLKAMISAPETWTTTRFRDVSEGATGVHLESFFQRWAPNPGQSINALGGKSQR